MKSELYIIKLLGNCLKSCWESGIWKASY